MYYVPVDVLDMYEQCNKLVPYYFFFGLLIFLNVKFKFLELRGFRRI